MAVSVDGVAANSGHIPTSRLALTPKSRKSQEQQMKRLLIAAATVLGLSTGAAFAQSAALGAAVAMPVNPSAAGAGGYLFPNAADEPMAPPTVAPTQEPSPISHIFLFPPADESEAAAG
jgi:hypothetical protein